MSNLINLFDEMWESVLDVSAATFTELKTVKKEMEDLEKEHEEVKATLSTMTKEQTKLQKNLAYALEGWQSGEKYVAPREPSQVPEGFEVAFTEENVYNLSIKSESTGRDPKTDEIIKRANIQMYFRNKENGFPSGSFNHKGMTDVTGKTYNTVGDVVNEIATGKWGVMINNRFHQLEVYREAKKTSTDGNAWMNFFAKHLYEDEDEIKQNSTTTVVWYYSSIPSGFRVAFTTEKQYGLRLTYGGGYGYGDDDEYDYATKIIMYYRAIGNGTNSIEVSKMKGIKNDLALDTIGKMNTELATGNWGIMVDKRFYHIDKLENDNAKSSTSDGGWLYLLSNTGAKKVYDEKVDKMASNNNTKVVWFTKYD